MKVPRITKDRLKQKLIDGDPILLLDVRNPTDYGASDVKIIDSIRVSEDRYEELARETDPARDVVAYCT